MPARTVPVDVLGISALLLLLPAAPAWSEQVGGELLVLPPEEEVQRHEAPDPDSVPEVLRLRAAAVESPGALEALRTQEVSPGVPYQNGFARSGRERRVEVAGGTLRGDAAEVGEVRSTTSTTVSWLGRFAVEGAFAFRVLLRDPELPEGARIWVHAGDVQLGPYGRELVDPEGRLWLPPAPGPEAVVEVQVPTEGEGPVPELAFTLGEVMEVFDVPEATGADPQHWTDCDIDAMCIDTNTLSTIDILREAAARLSFVEGNSSFLCSGGLLNDTDTSGFRPFLLTANHCFDTQASASSLVAYFDYRTSSCGGSAPSLGSVPSVAGSTLLATSPDSDFTLVELSAVPSGFTWFLGWTTASVTSGQAMDRVSHPAGTTQKYSASSYTGSSGIVCSGLPVSDFHYSEGFTGSTTGGSSGAPVTVEISDDAFVVGQLFGVCRFSTWDECAYNTFNYVDGAFAVTYPFIAPWIDPGCSPDGFEPDDSSGAASSIASGSPQAHSICGAGDEDWVTFTLSQESEVVLETSGSSGDTRMWLFDSGLSLVEFDDDDGSSLFSRIDRVCDADALPADTYFVKIDEFGDDDPIDDYTLTYTRVQGCGSCPSDLTLANTTLSGTQTFLADDTITLGPSLVVDGTSIDVIAGDRVVITSGTEIGGSFSAGTHPSACSL